MTRRIIAVAAVLVFAGAGFAFFQVEQRRRVESRLEEIRTASAKQDFSGTIECTIAWDGGRKEFRVGLSHTHPSTTRTEFRGFKNEAGEWITPDENWRRDAPHRESPSSRGSHRNWLSPILDSELASRNYVVTELAPETVAGREALTLELRPRRSGGPAFKLWADRETKLPLALETFDADGKQATRFAFTSIRLEADPVLAAKEPRPGPPREKKELTLEELKTRPPFPVWIPSYVPDGFRLLKAEHSTRGSSESVKLIYSDGMTTLTVSEGRPGSSWFRQPATPTEDGKPVVERSVYRGMQMLKVQLKDTVVSVMGWGDVNELTATITSMTEFRPHD